MAPDRKDEPPRQTGEADATDWHSAARFASLKPGELFAARYRIVRRLGHGGTGEVFLCHDELAGIDCAVKALYPGPQKPPIERLRRELRLMRKVSHPGIVKVYDIGESEGLLYLVMEYLAGETLAFRLQREPHLHPNEAERIIREIFDALGAAHEAGVVHRDIKPANALLTEDGGRIVLLDFGLAWHPVEPTLTRTGGIIGTPHYMSPEQASGSTDIGPATDLYSAGIILWEMLAGSPPFGGGSTAEVLNAHLHRPLPPVGRSLRESPHRLRALVLRLLEKRPQDRPHGAATAVALLATPTRKLRAHQALRTMMARRGLAFRSAVAVLALGSFFFVLLYPLQARVEQGVIVFKSAVGIRTWTQEYGRPVQDVRRFSVKDAWLPKYVATLAPRPEPRQGFPDDYPSGLVLLTPLAKQETPLRLHGLVDQVPPPMFGYDGVYSLSAPRRLPWRYRGRPSYISAYGHLGHYPSAVSAFDDTGRVILFIPHPGTINLGFGIREGAGEVRPALVFSAKNNMLGGRSVAFAVVGRVLEQGTASVPPYSDILADGEPLSWYTLLDEAFNPGAVLIGDAVTIGSRGTTIRLDPANGVPLDEQQRDGLTPEEWRQERELLLDEFMQAATADLEGRAVDGAERLERLATNRLRATVHVGAAFGRAAELYRNGGRFAESARVAGKAWAIETRITGHYRIHIDALTRAGDWSELDRVGKETGLTTFQAEVRRDLVLAWLLGGRVDKARVVASSYPPKEDPFYEPYSKAVIALHEGDPAEAWKQIQRKKQWSQYPEIRFLGAVSALLADPPDIDLGRAHLDHPEIANGVGQVFPIAALEALLAHCSGQGFSREALADELRRQRDAASQNIVDLYFLGWGEVLYEHLVGQQLDPPAERPDLAKAAQSARNSPFAQLVSRAAGSPAN